MVESAPGADEALEFEDPVFFYAIPKVRSPENVGTVRVKNGGFHLRVRGSIVLNPISGGLIHGEVFGVRNESVGIACWQANVPDDGGTGGVIIVGRAIA